MPTEAARLRRLYQLELLDTPAEKDFDEIVLLASQITRTPISLITLLDTDRQWFKANVGLDCASTDRESAVCNYTIQGDDLFEVENLATDKRFAKNRLITEGPKLRYYAGIPLTTSDGYKLGALCVIDIKSRAKLTDDQALALRVLANQAMKQIELRVKNRDLASLKEINSRILKMIDEDYTSVAARQKAKIGVSEDGLPVERDVVMGFNEHTLNNVLEWGRLQRKQLRAYPDAPPLVQVIEDCTAEFQGTIREKANELIIDIDPLSAIPIDPAALCFMLRNLIHNANKYTEGGKITIRYFNTPGSGTASPRHYVSVSDTGVGIQPFDLKNYTDGKEITRKAGTKDESGSGNGLLLVGSILQQLGGKLHLESKVGEFTTAIVII